MILTAAMITIVATHAASSVSSSGTATFGGTVPTTFNISNINNGSLSGAFGSFGTLVVGNGMLNTPSPVVFRLRSNAPYILTAQVGALVGISDGEADTGSSTTIKTGDIGFGFTAAIDQSGGSVAGGGAAPTRVDTIAPGFDMRGGWPSASGGRTPVFTKTLHDIYGQDVQILNGPQISAKGDNSSDDNFITITVGIATLPQYWNAGAFRGVVTFTIAPAGM
jgi:hypothetical protein